MTIRPEIREYPKLQLIQEAAAASLRSRLSLQA